jgi:glyoxalase family protein
VILRGAARSAGSDPDHSTNAKFGFAPDGDPSGAPPSLFTMKITGLHHVTAIAGNPQRNLDFYAGVLGLRLVKRTVNFDDPGSYHFYFGDAVGTPGTILTFFPWPSARRGVRGAGEVEATAFAIPAASTAYWSKRLHDHKVSVESATLRFGEEVLRFADPDGLIIELIASKKIPDGNPFQAVPCLKHMPFADCMGHCDPDKRDDSARLLTELFGYRLAQESEDRARFSAPDSADFGKEIDLLIAPGLSQGRPGAGTVHHIAFRVATASEQLDWQRRISDLGYRVSPVMDRTYFQSIYFREPGGILFEIATDVPGFTSDEAESELGTNLRLPSWMERSRARIEAVLPAITLPNGVNS